MGDATDKYFLAVFEEAMTILDDNRFDHLVIGSVANTAHLGSPWDAGSDVDFLMRKEDAQRCLEIFPGYGYSTHVRDPYWIFKVAKPNMTIDLIFRASSRVELDDEMLGASTVKLFEHLQVPVPAVEDMALLFILLDTDDRQGYWYDAMQYLRRAEEWDYLVKRAERYGPRKMLSALLYAGESGIEVPQRAVDALLAAVDR